MGGEACGFVGRAPLASISKQSFDRLVDVPEQFLEGFALGCAAGNCRHLSPIATLFRFVNDYFQLHGGAYVSQEPRPRADGGAAYFFCSIAAPQHLSEPPPPLVTITWEPHLPQM